MSMTSIGNACNTSNIYLTPPAWYTTTNILKPTQVHDIPQKIPF